jgi:GxxExxY protein
MLTNPDDANDLTARIIGCAIQIHRAVGPGLLESVYHRCMMLELTEARLHAACGIRVPVVYRGVELGAAYYLDMLVEDRVVLEIKSVAVIAPVHTAQLITYLRLTGKTVGLLINFNVPVLKDGVKRVLNTGARGIVPVRPKQSAP